MQVDGYFTDTSTTNPLHGWKHDSQFVIRLPERWNGRMVVAGAPGVRRQYSSDFLVSDRVLAQGYAYASIDKGNTGASFFRDGRPAARTYMTGVSIGGYRTRWQLENEPGVFDGGVESEGTLVEAEHNVLGFLSEALRAYPAYRHGTGVAKEAARQRLLPVGCEPGSEPLWDLRNRVY